MKIGYIRVSKHEQHEDLQQDALLAAKCNKLFTDKISGVTEKRKGLEEALAYLQKGDTLVVWKLDRAGRSLAHLMKLLKDLQQREISFVSLTEQIDTSTPSIVTTLLTSHFDCFLSLGTSAEVLIGSHSLNVNYHSNSKISREKN
jgi:DNA invertase Pin-like site-specific DNA recombinase